MHRAFARSTRTVLGDGCLQVLQRRARASLQQIRVDEIGVTQRAHVDQRRLQLGGREAARRRQVVPQDRQLRESRDSWRQLRAQLERLPKRLLGIFEPIAAEQGKAQVVVGVLVIGELLRELAQHLHRFIVPAEPDIGFRQVAGRARKLESALAQQRQMRHRLVELLDAHVHDREVVARRRVIRIELENFLVGGDRLRDRLELVAVVVALDVVALARRQVIDERQRPLGIAVAIVGSSHVAGRHGHLDVGEREVRIDLAGLLEQRHGAVVTRALRLIDAGGVVAIGLHRRGRDVLEIAIERQVRLRAGS